MIDPADAYVWSFLPNWSSGFSTSREYWTDIIPTRSRRENRRALRQTPRRRFEFQSVCANSTELREFNTLMGKVQDKPFIVPDWSRRSALSLDAASGTDILTFDTLPNWMFEGRALFLWDRRTRPSAVYVDTIDGTEVTLQDTLAADWSTETVVLPGPVGKFSSELSTQNLTNTVKTIGVGFDVEAGSEPVSPATATATLGDREIFTLRPNWKEGVDDTLIWPSETVDFRRGSTAYFHPFLFPSMLRRASFVAQDHEGAEAITDLFDRMKGQRGEFYMPTGAPDIGPMLSLGGNNILVAGLQFMADFATSKVNKAIAVRLKNGTTLYRTVDSITESLIYPGNSIMNLNESWPAPIPLSDVHWISWMPVWRFASDILTMDWLTNEVAQCELTMRSLEALPVEIVDV